MINTQFVTNENVPFDKAHNNEIVYKSLKNKNIIRKIGRASCRERVSVTV
jgi:hypothetical protein